MNKCNLLLFFFRYYCTQTDKCDNYKTYKKTSYDCCEGFTTAPSPSDYHHKLYSNSNYYLKRNGCPRGKKRITKNIYLESCLQKRFLPFTCMYMYMYLK